MSGDWALALMKQEKAVSDVHSVTAINSNMPSNELAMQFDLPIRSRPLPAPQGSNATLGETTMVKKEHPMQFDLPFRSRPLATPHNANATFSEDKIASKQSVMQSSLALRTRPLETGLDNQVIKMEPSGRVSSAALDKDVRQIKEESSSILESAMDINLALRNRPLETVTDNKVTKRKGRGQRKKERQVARAASNAENRGGDSRGRGRRTRGRHFPTGDWQERFRRSTAPTPPAFATAVNNNDGDAAMDVQQMFNTLHLRPHHIPTSGSSNLGARAMPNPFMPYPLNDHHMLTRSKVIMPLVGPGHISSWAEIPPSRVDKPQHNRNRGDRGHGGNWAKSLTQQLYRKCQLGRE